ncbi:hypothetical protein PM082_018619 [Marasmius tenuissimus]|nr:hypothetical protein PM082_018619 [Marasmius tenuissimus]
MFLSGRSSRIAEDGTCLLGYKNYASISLIVYDFLQNLFFTVMFYWPLYKSKIFSPALRAVAKRTLIGAIAGLLILAANVSMVIAMGGYQVVWVCMTSCALDVILNALIMYWVSSGISSDSINHFTLPTINMVTRNDLTVNTSKTNDSVSSGDTINTLTTIASLRTAEYTGHTISTRRSADLGVVEIFKASTEEVSAE